MPLILPQTPQAPTRINPGIAVFYSLPKVGKTSNLAKLESCMILDLEGGADMYESLRVPVNSMKDVDEFIAAVLEFGAKNRKYPYKYIAVDTIDKLEDLCEVSATAKYKKTKLGSTFEGDSVLELPKGLGYYYLRNEVIRTIDRLKSVCPHLILISHVKEKLLEKGGIEATSRDISLAGKLSQMVCAKADVIGYMYRDKDKLMINFETYEGAVMGARFEHLAGKKFEFDWSKIYLPEESK